MRTKLENILIGLGAALVILGIWSLIAHLAGLSKILLPTPAAVWERFLLILDHGYKGHSLGAHLGDSLRRLFLAYGLAIVTALPLGLLSGCCRRLRTALDPVISFYRPLPPLAYYTLLVLWMGIDDGSKIALLYLAGFAPMYISAVAGVMRIRSDYINGARTLGANSVQIFFYVIFPVALPDIFVGLRNSIGFMYSTLVAAEMVAAVSGIGWMVLDASKYLQSDVIFAGIIIMGLTGVLLDLLLKLAESRIVFWRGRD
ncbi:MAG: ABC transporter permease [Deltaproteobacteria bacterium]|jgi:taurine transport system permease protein|nr:ABC transporter permease [Deltaproteobacteria bacterium]